MFRLGKLTDSNLTRVSCGQPRTSSELAAPTRKLKLVSTAAATVVRTAAQVCQTCSLLRKAHWSPSLPLTKEGCSRHTAPAAAGYPAGSPYAPPAMSSPRVSMSGMAAGSAATATNMSATPCKSRTSFPSVSLRE